MSKLTKRQIKSHAEACRLLEKDSLTFDEKWFVYENWHEGADNNIAAAGAYFTPIMLARDFGLDVCGPRVVDLCAGIGVLAFAYYHTKGDFENPPRITCVEINPRYVEIGRKLLPEATWICADVFDVWRALGRFDTAIANPPFGRVSSRGKRGPSYSGPDFEYRAIDIASEIADYGTFLVPQMSAPFRYSGAQCYERTTDGKAQRFLDETGIDMDAGCGVDTTCHKDEWKTPAPVTEIVCCDFTERQRPGQLDLFTEMAA